jgi:hypothetical protein
MHETYRMLGREREADFERDAQKFRRAAEVPRAAPTKEAAKTHRSHTRVRALLARLVGA